MKPYLHKFVKKTILLILISFSILSTSYSQTFLFGEKVKWEVGLNFGPSFFLGDLGGNSGKGTNDIKDINLEFTKMMKGVFITMYPKNWFGLRVAADVTYLEGSDDIINTTGINELWRKQRNLDFKTTVLEGYLAVEIFPTMLLNRQTEYEPRFRPYGLVGIGSLDVLRRISNVTACDLSRLASRASRARCGNEHRADLSRGHHARARRCALAGCGPRRRCS